MKLKQFIIEATKDIDDAITESSSILGVRGIVHFDVAVIANESAGVEGGVQVIGLAKGSAHADMVNQTTTRLQFDIQTRKAINPSQSSPYNPTKKI